jgi:hypothetical protein
MSNQNPLEQSTLEQTRLPEAESKAALESKIDQAQPAGDKADTGQPKPESDNQMLKSELPARQYDAQTEANARLSEPEQLSNQKAYEAAETAIDGNEQAANHALYARRYASEAAALTGAGDDAVNLDVAAAQMSGFKGDNYPTYDLTSSQEVASVKTHWDSNGNLSESAARAYKQDLSRIMGWNREISGLQQDGQNILAARDAGLPVPAELQNATPEQASTYLRDNSVLRIPDDHVQPVRELLAKDIQQFPRNYYLSDNPSQAHIDHVLQRIQGIGLKSGELQDIIQR